MSEIRLLQAIKKLKDELNNLDKKINKISNEKPKDGNDGIGIKDIKIDEEGHLIVILTNGEEIDLGILKEKLNVKPLIGIDGVGIKNVALVNKHLIVTLTNGKQIDAGVIEGGSGGEETDPIFTASPAYTISNQDITTWNNKSDFSGDYNDLDNKPTKVSEFTNDAGYLTEHQSLSGYATESWVEGKGYLTEEEEPDFNSSVAKDITQNDVTNWNNKVTDANYVHTDNNFTSTYKNKIDTNAQNIANVTTNLSENYYTKSETYTKSEVEQLTPIVVHLQDDLTADYTFEQILEAIERKQWVILKKGNDTFTVYTRNNDVIIWHSIIYLNNNIGCTVWTLTNANVWYQSSNALQIESAISQASTNYQLPTAKSVIDFINENMATQYWWNDQYGAHTLWEVQDASTGAVMVDKKIRQLVDSDYTTLTTPATDYKYILAYIQGCTGSLQDQEGASMCIRIDLDPRSATPRTGVYSGTQVGYAPNDDGVKQGAIVTINSAKTGFVMTWSNFNTTGTTALNRDFHLYKIEGYKN